jgi:hypothetical protein
LPPKKNICSFCNPGWRRKDDEEEEEEEEEEEGEEGVNLGL